MTSAQMPEIFAAVLISPVSAISDRLLRLCTLRPQDSPGLSVCLLGPGVRGDVPARELV